MIIRPYEIDPDVLDRAELHSGVVGYADRLLLRGIIDKDGQASLSLVARGIDDGIDEVLATRRLGNASEDTLDHWGRVTSINPHFLEELSNPHI